MEHLSNNNSNSKDLKRGFSAQVLSKTKTKMVSARKETRKAKTSIRKAIINVAVETKAAAHSSKPNLNARASQPLAGSAQEPQA